MIDRFFAAVVLLCSVGAHVGTPIEPAPALWAGLAPGQYRVGYQRLDAGGGVVVHAWYPTSVSGTRILFREYDGFAAAVFTGIAAVTHASGATARSVVRVTEQTGKFLLRYVR